MAQWYAYENDEVTGPFSEKELGQRIEPDTLVCPAGSEEWLKAGERTELQHLFENDGGDQRPDRPDEIVVGDLEPNLDTLTRIAREANAEELLREFKNYWAEYDRKEHQIIYREMKHLDILPTEEKSD